MGVRHLGAVATLMPKEAEVFEATVLDNITFGRAFDERAIGFTGFFSGTRIARRGSLASGRGPCAPAALARSLE